MKRLAIHLKNYKPHLIFGPFFKLLEAIFELIVPLVMAQVIDEGINQNAGTGYILSQMSVTIFAPETRTCPPAEVKSVKASCILSGNTVNFARFPSFTVTCLPQMRSMHQYAPAAEVSLQKASALVEQNGYPASIMAFP